MRKTVMFFVPAVAFVLVCSCNAFLSEVPDPRAEINEKEKIQRLLGSAYPDSAYVPFLEPRTDLVQDLSPDSGLSTDQINTDAFFWRTNDLDNRDTSLRYWLACYKAIASSNQALKSLAELAASKKVSVEDAMPIRGEALLCRAYAHFMLVSIWGEAYDPNKNDLGVPYVTEPEDVPLKSYKRNTVKEVYDLVEKDILEGIPLIEKGISYYTQPFYRFNLQAACAFASRFYLNKGDWEKTLEYGTKAFAGKDPNLVLRDIAAGPKYKGTRTDRARFYWSTDEPANLLLNSVNSVWGRSEGRYKFSQYLNTTLFSSNPSGDWAFDFFGTEYYLNIPKFEEYFKYTNRLTETGYPFYTFVLFSTDEVFLNNIEAKIMLGRNDEALSDINTILAKITEPFKATTLGAAKNSYGLTSGLYTPFYKVPDGYGLALLDFVLEIRKRIFLFEGMRWFDIKRHHIKITHNEYNGTKYVLDVNSPSRVLQIPNVATARGIAPNPE